MGAPKAHEVKYSHVGATLTIIVSPVLKKDTVTAGIYPACGAHSLFVPVLLHP